MCYHSIIKYYKTLKFFYFKYLSYFLIFFGLYFGGRIAVSGIHIFIIISIIDLVINGRRSIKDFPKMLLLPIIFYAAHIISALYSQNTRATSFDLEVKLSFLLLPLLFGFQKPDPRINLLIILRLYVFASLISGLILLINNILYYSENGQLLSYMTYSIFLHPSYLSMYFTFNILVGVFLLHKKTGNVFCILFSLLIALINIYFAESKAAIIVTFILLVYVLFSLISHRYRLIASLISLALFVVFLFFANKIHRFSSIPYVFEHLKETTGHPETAVESTALRVLVWQASLEVIKNNPLIGVGNGDVHTELSKVYKKRNIIHALQINMNAHNQYLETTIALGVVGLILLLAMLFLPLFYVQSNTFLLYGFILIIAINILVESMFNTQAGVIFFTFFYSLLISDSTSKRKQNPLL